MTNFSTVNIDDIVDQVARDPKQAKAAKEALKRLVGFSQSQKSFTSQSRPRASDMDDDLFDNMPI